MGNQTGRGTMINIRKKKRKAERIKTGRVHKRKKKVGKEIFERPNNPTEEE